MGRRNEHSREELREMALEAAGALVAEQGFRGLSARKVAAAIGYTVGSLYLIFRNLDDLILQLNARTLDQLYEALLTTRQDCSAPRDCLLALGQRYIEFARQHHHRWKLIFEHQLPPDQDLPPWYLERVSRTFELVQSQLQALAGPRSPRELTLAAHALWSGVHGICVLSLDEKLDLAGHLSPEEVADSLVAHYLEGFTASGPHSG
ncbi:MAG: TetR/AcrR family transcriptional regulator [Candidatus Competibacteraceae bacterium]|nr:TetR/AcrR family transcriptional regulator [Candidatus Competibacteraceae bacterium]